MLNVSLMQLHDYSIFLSFSGLYSELSLIIKRFLVYILSYSRNTFSEIFKDMFTYEVFFADCFRCQTGYTGARCNMPGPGYITARKQLTTFDFVQIIGAVVAIIVSLLASICVIPILRRKE